MFFKFVYLLVLFLLFVFLLFLPMGLMTIISFSFNHVDNFFDREVVHLLAEHLIASDRSEGFVHELLILDELFGNVIGVDVLVFYLIFTALLVFIIVKVIVIFVIVCNYFLGGGIGPGDGGSSCGYTLS